MPIRCSCSIFFLLAVSAGLCYLASYYPHVKQSFTYWFLLVVVGMAAVNFSRNSLRGASRNISVRARVLNGMLPFISSGSRLGVVHPGADAGIYMQCRYLLAPVYITGDKEQMPDTVLYVGDFNGRDSAMMTQINNRRVLWQASDSIYHYYLTSIR